MLLAAALVVGCGKKAPPLPPLNLVPDAPSQTTGRVSADTVYLAMIVPAKNSNGRGTLALDHLEIYAVTVDAGAVAPPNRELLTNAHTIAKIPIKPPVDPDAEEPEESPDDTRPKGGDVVWFAEHLTEAQTTPQIKATPENAKQAAQAARSAAASAQPVAGAPSTPTVPPLTSPESVPATGAGAAVVGVPTTLPTSPLTAEGAVAGEAGAGATGTAAGSATTSPSQGAAAAAAAAKPAPTVTRVYVIRGITKKGHPGAPSARIVVPIVPPPPPPSGVTADFTETSVKLSWKAPEDTAAGTHAPMTFNVYPHAGSAQPAASGVVTVSKALNSPSLETASFEHAGAEPGKEQCFAVTTVEMISSIAVESEPSAPVCVTPVDRFAPAAPTGLAVVATTGALNLIWDANHEADVAGYLVLRGEAPGDTLQPLTPEPIRETRFRDTAAQPGVRYAYAIVAVDRAGNRGAPSARVEETAR